MADLNDLQNAYVPDVPDSMPGTIMAFIEGGDEIESLVLGAQDAVILKNGQLEYRNNLNEPISTSDVELVFPGEDEGDDRIQALFGIDYCELRSILTHNYQVENILIQCPDVNQYGMPPMASPERATRMMEEDLLLASHLTDDSIDVFDLGDDGGGFTLITLRRL